MANDENEPLYSQVPIPTYEEATSSTPRPSQYHLGPSEVSDDSERQAFLAPHPSPGPRPPRRRNGYQAPSVQSVRNSEDTLDGIIHSDSEDEDHEDEELRRDMEEMEMDDTEAGTASGMRRRMRSRFGKRMNWLGTTLSEIRLPRVSMPSMDWLTQRLPRWKWSLPEEYRPGWQLIARLFGLMIVVGLIYALLVLEVFPGSRADFPYDPERLRIFAQSAVDEGRIADSLRHITGYPHIAGSEGDLYLAKWMKGKFEDANLDSVSMLPYEVYLNYPTKDGRKVSIVEPEKQAWTAKLEEESPYQQPKQEQQNTWVFHGHSKSGTAQGPLIYANYGSREDFKGLQNSGIDVNGTIALVRQGGTQSDLALKVKAAEESGCVGALIYSDPAEDGFKKGDVWPKGRWRPTDSVQRGAVSLMRWVVGDVLTPDWGQSLPNLVRLEKENSPGLVKIPSLPLAWRDAEHLLKSLKGHGIEIPRERRDGVPDIQYWSGDKKSPVVELKNEQLERQDQEIWNVVGMIKGIEQPNKRLVVGNHRDSWCFGAGDPGSGTAVMLEVVRILGELKNQGWRPLRTIEFASWDAAEYNLIGSTEFVEDNLDVLRADGVAYLNVDVGVVGDSFRAASSPALENALLRVLKRVGDPFKNATFYDLWLREKKTMEGLGMGSDYVAFQDLAGLSSLDFGFEGPKGGFPYHSCYETFEWMDKFGDPGFQYHKALAQIWVLLILEIAQEPLLPIDLRKYAEDLKSYVDKTLFYAKKNGAPSSFNLKPLNEAVERVGQVAEEFHAWDDEWFGIVIANNGFESNVLTLKRHWRNDRLAEFESNLLDIPGREEGDKHEDHGVSPPFLVRRIETLTVAKLPGRKQFKHVVFGPQKWSGSEEQYFPFVVDAIDDGDWKLAQAQVAKSAKLLSRAADELLK